jgi:UPF0755 protein
MSGTGTTTTGRRRADAPPPQRDSRLKAAIAVLIALLLLAGLVGAAYTVVQGIAHKVSSTTSDDYSGAGTGTVQVELKKGDTAAEMGRRLKAAGVIRTVQAFVDAARSDTSSETIQPGVYNLHKHMSAQQALTLLLDPSSKSVIKVVVPEGLRVNEIVALLSQRTRIPQATFTAALKSPKLGLPAFAKGKPEGMLFPATYSFEPGDTPLEMLQAMVTAEKQELAKLGIGQGNNPYKVITVASMLEKEVNNAGDYGRAARVAYNRLDAGEALGFDSALHYYYGDDKQLTTARLKVNTPYNLRTHQGLPPTPISNPGEATLKAALEPTPGAWKWFVTIDEKSGKTLFFTKYRDFVAARAKYGINF